MRQAWRVILEFSKTGWPSIRTVPPDGLRNPASTDSRLVLPAPLRPSSP
jgi:hypothetical protein